MPANNYCGVGYICCKEEYTKWCKTYTNATLLVICQMPCLQQFLLPSTSIFCLSFACSACLRYH